MANINLMPTRDQMTKRERVEATLNFEETDRVCTCDILRNIGAIEYLPGQR